MRCFSKRAPTSPGEGADCPGLPRRGPMSRQAKLGLMAAAPTHISAVSLRLAPGCSIALGAFRRTRLSHLAGDPHRFPRSLRHVDRRGARHFSAMATATRSKDCSPRPYLINTLWPSEATQCADRVPRNTVPLRRAGSPLERDGQRGRDTATTLAVNRPSSAGTNTARIWTDAVSAT